MNRQCVAGMLCGLLLAVMSACTVGPPYQRPQSATPEKWKETATEPATPAAAYAPAASVSVWPDSDWWRGFASPQLDQLIAEAQRNNDDLAGALARVQEADAQVRIAGAPLFPALDLGAAATRERASVAGVGPRVFNVFSSQLTASYELDFWGKNRALRAAARAAAVASRYDRQTVALSVINGVATTYFQALASRDLIEVARQNLANGQKILRGLQLEQAVGTITGLDVALQETAVAQLDAALPPLQQQYRQSVYALAVLVGRAPESLELTDTNLTNLPGPTVTEGLPSELLARRPDVARAEQQLIAANADITVARAALFPSIALTASGGYESGVLTSLISPANRFYAVSAGLTQPIFHGGALRGQVSYSKARYTELLTAYHKAVLTAFGNVESALVATRQTVAQQQRQAIAVDKARRAYVFAEMQMKQGVVNILTVLNTENALFSAQDALVRVEYAHVQALIDLFTALGGGWKE